MKRSKIQARRDVVTARFVAAQLDGMDDVCITHPTPRTIRIDRRGRHARFVPPPEDAPDDYEVVLHFGLQWYPRQSPRRSARPELAERHTIWSLRRGWRRHDEDFCQGSPYHLLLIGLGLEGWHAGEPEEP